MCFPRSDFPYAPAGHTQEPLSPARLSRTQPATPTSYNAQVDPFAMHSLAHSLKEDVSKDVYTQHPSHSGNNWGRSWYGA